MKKMKGMKKFVFNKHRPFQLKSSLNQLLSILRLITLGLFLSLYQLNKPKLGKRKQQNYQVKRKKNIDLYHHWTHYPLSLMLVMKESKLKSKRRRNLNQRKKTNSSLTKGLQCPCKKQMNLYLHLIDLLVWKKRQMTK